jgi:hypothetical protein
MIPPCLKNDGLTYYKSGRVQLRDPDRSDHPSVRFWQREKKFQLIFGARWNKKGRGTLMIGGFNGFIDGC